MDQLGCYGVMDASLNGNRKPLSVVYGGSSWNKPRLSLPSPGGWHVKLKWWIIRVYKALFEIFIHPLTMLLIKSSKLNKLKASHAVRVCYPFTHPFIHFIRGRDHSHTHSSGVSLSHSRRLWHLGEWTANLLHIVCVLYRLANNHPMLYLHTLFFISCTASSPCAHKGSAPGTIRHTACTGILCSFWLK